MFFSSLLTVYISSAELAGRRNNFLVIIFGYFMELSRQKRNIEYWENRNTFFIRYRVRYRGDHLKRNFMGTIFNSRFEIILFDPVMAESVLLWGEKGIASVFHCKGNNWIWIAEWKNRHAETFKQTIIENKNKQTITFLK